VEEPGMPAIEDSTETMEEAGMESMQPSSEERK
jgi:hypothetical protein